jgi:hypothetical protein
MKADQVTNAYDYNSLVLLYIKMGTEKNPNIVLSAEDTVAEGFLIYCQTFQIKNFTN